MKSILERAAELSEGCKMPMDQAIELAASEAAARESVLSSEVLRLRARISDVQAAYAAAVEAASAPTDPKAGIDKRQWDDGYRNGVQACASVVWAALQPRGLGA